MSDLIIGGVKVDLGETKEINLFVSKLYDFTEIYMPVKVIRGKQKGPRLFICAGIHGDELNGVEIIKRLIQKKIFKNMKGDLVLVPIVNVYGFNNLSRYLPDRRDLNRCFPGSSSGPLASRLANLFVKEVVSQCTHGIDLHTGAIHRTNLPQIRACLGSRETIHLANAFDVPVIIDADVIQGSLRAEAFEREIPILVFEGGEALRYDELAIRTGLAGIISAMRELGMIAPLKKKVKRVKSFIAKGTSWVRASQSGMIRVSKKLGSLVEKGDLLAVISNPLGTDHIEVTAPKKGVVIGHTQLPLVNRGDAIFHVATFVKSESVGESIEHMDDKFDYEER